MSNSENLWARQHPEGKYTKVSKNHMILWNFDVNSAELKPEHQKGLKQFISNAGLLILHGRTKIEVIGRASSSGSDSNNLQLSRRRAEAVTRFLRNDLKLINRRLTESIGESPSTITPNDSGEHMARNRCVEIKADYQPVNSQCSSKFEFPPFVPSRLHQQIREIIRKHNRQTHLVQRFSLPEYSGTSNEGDIVLRICRNCKITFVKLLPVSDEYIIKHVSANYRPRWKKAYVVAFNENILDLLNQRRCTPSHRLESEFNSRIRRQFSMSFTALAGYVWSEDIR